MLSPFKVTKARVLLAILAMFLVVSTVFQFWSERTVMTRYPPPGRLIDIGGLRLHLHCVGEGQPVILLDSGIGAASFEWVYVQRSLASVTRVCTYDRAGYGWSDPSPAPRTASVMADELHRLTVAAGLAPPFLLVGHSSGGFNMRLYASRYPGQTAALVLLDSLEEDELALGSAWHQTLMSVLPLIAYTGLTRIGREFVIDRNLPGEVQEAADALRPRIDAYSAASRERAALKVSAESVRKASLPPNLRLLVLSRAKGRRPFDGPWEEAQCRLTRLTANSSRSVAARSHHYLQIFEPQFVVKALRSIVTDWRQTQR